MPKTDLFEGEDGVRRPLAEHRQHLQMLMDHHIAQGNDGYVTALRAKLNELREPEAR